MLSKEQFLELRKKGLSVDQIVRFEGGGKPQPQQQQEIPQEQGYSGIGSSVVNFGKDIAQGAYLALGGQKKIDTTTQQYLDNGNKLFELAKKQADPERKKQLLLQAQEMYSDAEKVGGNILGKVRTNKQIIADALGTLGTGLVAGTPATSLGAKGVLGAQKAISSVGSRLLMGTGFGAGAGAQQALSENENLGNIVKKTAIGGAVGLGVSGAMEGIAFGLRKLAQTKSVQKFIGNIYNRELKPQTQDIVADLERHAKTIGERASQEVNAVGKPIYKGGYNTMAKQAEQQIKNNATTLRNQLTQYPQKTIQKSSLLTKLKGILSDVYGKLDDNQLGTLRAEIDKLPVKMNATEALDLRQIIDSKIPKGFWIEPNPQKAFIGNVRYYLRGLLKESIEQAANTTPVKQLNQKIGLAIDIKDLAYFQQAIRMKGGATGALTTVLKPIAWALDRTIFNPVTTTRIGQGMRGAGQKTGNMLLENLATKGGVDILGQLNKNSYNK